MLNDVTFLLEGHVLQAEHATTPLKQLYFAIQSALMEPGNILAIVPMVTDMLSRTMATFQNNDVRRGLLDVGELIDRGRFFEALRVVRGLYPVELDILNARVSSPEAA